METTGPMVENNSYNWASVALDSKSPTYKDVLEAFSSAAAAPLAAAAAAAAAAGAGAVVLLRKSN